MQDVLTGNYLPLESMPILTVSSTSINNPSVNAINSTASKNRLLDEQEASTTDSDPDAYIYIPSSVNLSNCSTNIVAYIAGFVVYKLKKHYAVNCV